MCIVSLAEVDFETGGRAAVVEGDRDLVVSEVGESDTLFLGIPRLVVVVEVDLVAHGSIDAGLHGVSAGIAHGDGGGGDADAAEHAAGPAAVEGRPVGHGGVVVVVGAAHVVDR